MNKNVEYLDDDSKDLHNSTFFASENNSLNDSGIVEMNDKKDIERCEELLYDDKVYGNNIKDKFPKRFGNTFTCLYVKNNPLIVIGPDCIIYLII